MCVRSLLWKRKHSLRDSPAFVLPTNRLGSSLPDAHFLNVYSLFSEEWTSERELGHPLTHPPTNSHSNTHSVGWSLTRSLARRCPPTVVDLPRNRDSQLVPPVRLPPHPTQARAVFSLVVCPAEFFSLNRRLGGGDHTTPPTHSVILETNLGSKARAVVFCHRNKYCSETKVVIGVPARFSEVSSRFVPRPPISERCTISFVKKQGSYQRFAGNESLGKEIIDLLFLSEKYWILIFQIQTRTANFWKRPVQISNSLILTLY